MITFAVECHFTT